MSITIFLANKDNLLMDFFLDDISSKNGNLITPITSGGKTNNKEQVARIFDAINVNLSSELVSKTGAIFQFNVTGKLMIICDFNIII